MRNTQCLSVPKIWLSSLFLLLSLFCSQGASAQSFYWQIANKTYKGPTPLDVCTYEVALLGSSLTPELIKVNDGQWTCRFRRPDGSGALVGQIYRYGQCPADATFNPATGACDVPPPDACKSTLGNYVYHWHKVESLAGGPVDLPTDSVCHQSCLYTVPALEVGTCRRDYATDKNGVFCAYSYRGAGQSCEASSGAPDITHPTDPVAKSDSTTDCTNKVYDSEGRMQYSCTKWENYSDPGNFNCGEVNGEIKCFAKSPVAKMEDTKVTSDVTEKTNPDGSKDTTTTTTTEKTVCIGEGACTTTTSTTVTNNRTNADGSSGGSSSSCTGSGCKDSDGKSQDERKEEEEGQKKVSGAEQCGTPVVCSGDALSCELIRQQKNQRCADEEFREVTAAKATELETTLNTEFSGAEYQPLTATAEGTFDLSTMVDTSSRFSRSCPAIPDVSVPWISGSVSIPVSSVFSQLCPYLAWFGYFVVAFAMRRGAEIVAQGMN